MWNLLRSDAYRAVHSPFFWVIAAILVAGVVAIAGLMNWICSPEFTQMINDTVTEENLRGMTPEERAEAMADLEEATSQLEPLNGKVLESLTATWASTFLDGGFLGLMGSLFVAIYLLSDFKRGFAKNLPMGRAGRRAYYAEKLVFVALAQALFLLACAGFSTLSYAAFGFAYERADSAADIALWLLVAWLVCTAYATVVACISWAVRSEALSAVAAVAVSTGTLGAFAAQLLLYVGKAFPALEAVPQWLPASALADLRHGAESLLAPGADYVLSAAPAAAHAIVVTLLAAAVMIAIVFAACRRKDIC